MFFAISDIFGKMDPTKIRVTGGDVPEGDWIFNGQAMIYSPKQSDKSKDNENNRKTRVELKGQLRIVPVKAEEFGVVRQLASNMAPLGGAIAGAAAAGPIGIMGGFAAGSWLSQNKATFHCELADGRRFDAVADFKIFKRLQEISIK